MATKAPKTRKLRKTETSTKDRYFITQEVDGDKKARTAVLTYQDGEFEACAYVVSRKSYYTYDDFMFLGHVAKEIQRISLNS